MPILIAISYLIIGAPIVLIWMKRTKKLFPTIPLDAADAAIACLVALFWPISYTIMAVGLLLRWIAWRYERCV